MLKLIADNLSVSRGGRTIIDGLSFQVTSGEALLLTGPNGAGKTTLLRSIAGLIKPEAGLIAIDGGDAEATVSEQCHFVGHLDAVKPSLTSSENLAFWQAALTDDPPGATAAAAARPTGSPTQALDRFGLANLGDVPAGYLSAGQKRRLGLARLLVAYRPIWLLDEPSVSLDSASVATFAAIAAEHLASGGIVLAATHMPLGLIGARELALDQRVVTL